MTLLITPLNTQSLQSPSITDPFPVPVYDLKSFYRSLAAPEMRSLSFNEFRSIEKNPIPWSTWNQLFAMKKFYSPSSESDIHASLTPSSIPVSSFLLLSRSPHSFLFSILPPSWTVCRTLLFMSCHYDRPPFSLCLFYPIYCSFKKSRSHHKVPQLPLFYLFLRFHLNPLFLSEPITLSMVARLVNI